MPITQTAFRIDSELKKRAEDTMKNKLSITATEAITGLYQYIDQYGELPFIIQTSVAQIESIQERFIKGLNNAITSTKHLAQLFKNSHADESEVQNHKDIIWAYRNLLINNNDYINALPKDQQEHWKGLIELLYDTVIMIEMPIRTGRARYSDIEPYVQSHTENFANILESYRCIRDK